MHPIVEKEKEICSYLEEWILARYGNWNDFYIATSRDRRFGIYQLESGTELMNLLNDIIGNIEDHLAFESGQHLIPSHFSSLSQLLQFLEDFNNHLKNHFYLIEKNLKGEDTSMIIWEMYRMCNDINQMVIRCQSIYLTDEDTPIPYQKAKSALQHNDVIHVITSVLGMSPLSEVETNDGRIDMEIEFPNCVYILEFKYSEDGKNRSREALNQIKDKNYARRSYMKGKTIEGVGMSFSKKTRNIDVFVQERLYVPLTSLYNIPGAE